MTTWVFLRGLTRESRHWGGFVDQFQQTIPGSTVIALDLPGNGLLNTGCSPWRVQDMVAQCRAQLALRNIEPPFHLLAMSLGAMVAVTWSHAHPQEISRSVLINTSMRPFSPFYQRLRPANYAALLRLVLLQATPEEWERTVLRLTSNRGNDAVLPHWLALRQNNPVSTANAFRQLIAAARYAAPSSAPPVHTLALASEHDHLVSVECSRALARHWHCPLNIHPSAGHDLPLDDGPWVASQVRSWLQACCGARVLV